MIRQLLFLLMLCLPANAFAFADFVEIEEGTTSLSVFTEDNVEIKINLTVVPNSEENPFTDGYWWGAGDELPVTLIGNLSVYWGEDKCTIPISAYFDLTNPYAISAAFVERQLVIWIKGGDAGTSYFARLVFMEGYIINKRVADSIFSDQGWDVTTYSYTLETY